MSEMYDIGVLGGGPAALAVIEAARLRGLRVVCVDRRPLVGGTCLHEGCIPSKALLHGSYCYANLTSSALAAWGIRIPNAAFELKALMHQKQAIVERLAKGAQTLMQGKDIRYLCGQGRVEKDGAQHLLVVDDGKTAEQRFAVRFVVLATGSVPVALPSLPLDGAGVVDSSGCLTLEEVPKHLAVIGGGYIGLELGSVWRRLGAKVSVFEQMDDIVMMMDKDIRQLLRRALSQQGLEFHLQAQVKGYEKKGRRGYRLIWQDKDGRKNSSEVSHILVAVGRKAEHGGVDLESLGVRCDKRGFIIVDEQMRTQAEKIWAVGDVVGGMMLAHKADAEGHRAVASMMGEASERLLPQHIPAVVYTHPEVATVGYNEESLQAQKTVYGRGVSHFRANGRAHTMGDESLEGFVKVLRAEDDRILGVHIIGTTADSLIGEAVAALRFSASCQDMAQQCQAHPSLNEALTRAARAAQLASLQ